MEQLTNVEKAKIMFDLFRDEIPEFINYAQYIAGQVVERHSTRHMNIAFLI